MRFFFEYDNDLNGVVLITPFHEGDARGSFTKDFEKNIYKQNGLTFDIFEEFTSVSSRNVIRGLHFQTVGPQAKLVTVPIGAVFDVVVDLRLGSKTFGNWKGFSLTDENKLTLYVPRGFAHGFLTLGEGNQVVYKCDEP